MAIRLLTRLFFASILSVLPLSGAFAKDKAIDADIGASTSGNAANISELQALMQRTNLAELRTTFNGSYGASLLLDRDTRTYYAASFQHKVFFRVFKNRSEENAEKHYRRLSGWTEVSAKDEIANMKKTVKTNRNVRLGEKSAGLDGGVVN